MAWWLDGGGLLSLVFHFRFASIGFGAGRVLQGWAGDDRSCGQETLGKWMSWNFVKCVISP